MIRTFVKRMNRLRACFSKRWDIHRAALAMFFGLYNYCRKHATLDGHTPAMAHGLTTDVLERSQDAGNVGGLTTSGGKVDGGP